MKSIYHDPALEEGKSHRKWFENVKLIGEIDKGTSIYIEDYAYTYLQQCASYDLSYESSAVLIGEQDTENGKTIIYGVVFVEPELLSEDSKWVDQGVFNAIEEDIRHYFPEGECVGWMHTQPGYGIMATTQEMDVHKNLFGENYLLMLIDPVYDQEAFFTSDGNKLERKQGFCMYYEKNEQMQKYMEDYPIRESKRPVEDDKVVGEFRELGAKRKKEVEKKKERSRLINIMVAGTLITAAFIMGTYSQKNKIDSLKKDVANIENQYSEGDHRISDHPVELVFTSAQVEPEEELVPEPEPEPEPVLEHEVISEPEIKPEVKAQPENDVHVVKIGDSLLRISYNYYQTVGKAKDIAEFNDIQDYDTIYIGQELKLPNKVTN